MMSEDNDSIRKKCPGATACGFRRKCFRWIPAGSGGDRDHCVHFTEKKVTQYRE